MSTPVSEKYPDDTYPSPTSIAIAAPREPLSDATNIKRRKTRQHDKTTQHDVDMMKATQHDEKPLPTTADHQLSILTYEVTSNISVQVTSSHTLYDLVDVVCKETRVGYVWEHMWNVTSHLDKKMYESGDFECMSKNRAEKTRLGSIQGGRVVGADLVLSYDYGSTRTFPMKLTDVQDKDSSSIDESCLPRRVPVQSPPNFVPYNPSSVADAANMDELFPDLSKFFFDEPDDMEEEYNTISLFQPGRKKVQAFLSNMYKGCRHMIHIPERFDSVEQMLWSVNQSVKHDKPPCTGGYPDSNWFGMSIFPYDDGCTEKYQKYKDAEYPGLDCTVARKCPPETKAFLADKFLKTFPKCAAAAGYSKPSKSSERGWIVYREGVVTVCRGASKNIKSRAPSPGVWDGVDKHEPVDDTAVIGKVSVQVKSLQELFCTAEALF